MKLVKEKENLYPTKKIVPSIKVSVVSEKKNLFLPVRCLFSLLGESTYRVINEKVTVFFLNLNKKVTLYWTPDTAIFRCKGRLYIIPSQFFFLAIWSWHNYLPRLKSKKKRNWGNFLAWTMNTKNCLILIHFLDYT